MIRTPKEWNVDICMFLATGPTKFVILSFISRAALFVNVIAKIW